MAMRDKLRSCRRLLQNPYAHLEEIEARDLLRLHENPYRTEQDVQEGGASLPRSLSEIEAIVTNLQRRLWRMRMLMGLESGSNPVEVLQPEYAAKLLGYKYALAPSARMIGANGKQIVVAGLFDPVNRIIRVGAEIEPHVARFTGSHEIGHAVLHPHIAGLHRDRPLSGGRESRDRIEYEADKFATYFLMPGKLVRDQFVARFLDRFRLNDESAYALFGKSASSASVFFPTRRHLSRALAEAVQFNGRYFDSMTEYFGVSVEAMAIRLEELDLVAGNS